MDIQNWLWFSERLPQLNATWTRPKQWIGKRQWKMPPDWPQVESLYLGKKRDRRPDGIREFRFGVVVPESHPHSTMVALQYFTPRIKATS